jgi:hypothetical protein
MNLVTLPACIGLLAVSSLAANEGAAQAPLRASTLQKAAAGAIAAFHVADAAPWSIAVLTYDTRDLVDVTLKWLNSATTFERLRNATDGLNQNCPKAGYVTVRIAAANPRMIKLQWNACVFERSGWDHTLRGPGEVTLLADTLTPTTVAEIRLGDASTDLREELTIINSSTSIPDVHARNLRLCGTIPLEHADGPFVGSFAYELAGVYNETTYYAFPGETQPLAAVMQVSADRINVAGSYSEDASGVRLDDDLRLISGKITLVNVTPATTTQPADTQTTRFSAENLQIRRVTDRNVGTETLSIDGKTNYGWSAATGLGCNSGLYTFKTQVPMRRQLYAAYLPYDAGRLTVNDVATVALSLSASSDMTHVQLNVRKLGLFEFDGLSPATALMDAAACSN